MAELIKIALDAMGGDHAPKEIVKGAVMSLENKKISITLVGREKDILEELKLHEYDKDRIEIINASEVISYNDTPTVAIREKKDSSIVIGLNIVKEKKCQGFVSAGSTGALLAGATFIVGRIKGVQRPALGTVLPNASGFSFLIDCGANVDSKPNYLLQYAQMGSIYMENILGIKNPKVGLVNIGTEKEKGNALTKEVYPLLEESGLNFIGNVEPRDIPSGVVDVMVCDAFVGNVILKYTEGLSYSLLQMIKKEMLSKTSYKIGAYFAKGAFKNLKKNFQYDDIGGAPFLGLNSLVVKAHGSSGAKAINGAINQCYLAVENDLTNKISEKMQ